MITFSRASRTSDMNFEDRDSLSQAPDRWGRHDRLNQDEVIELAKAKDAGSIEARNTLVERNMQLVIRIAQGWTGRGVPLEDLIQEGAIGLMRAADLYDWTLGNTFSTFAGLRVVAACQRAIENQAELIRIPVHTRTTGLCGPEVRRARLVVSGDTPLINRKGTIVSDGITPFTIALDPNANTEDEALATVAADEAAGAVATALLLLTPNERIVIESRWLSGADEPVTLRAIGKQNGWSYEKVRLIEKDAMAKMRAALQGVEHAY